MAMTNGIPDLKWVRERLPVEEVARKLDLRFGTDGMLHCWRPERHQNGDRTPSVAIWRATNKVKCFGCDARPMGPIDLVMDVLTMQLPAAVEWIVRRFPEVPQIPKGRSTADSMVRNLQAGLEGPMELLVKSGVYARLRRPARDVAQALMAYAEDQHDGTYRVGPISYQALMRYGGIGSRSSVRSAIDALAEIGWLIVRPQSGAAFLRGSGRYILTPCSDRLMELANAVAEEERRDIEVERELRKQERQKRRREFRPRTPAPSPQPTAVHQGGPVFPKTVHVVY